MGRLFLTAKWLNLVLVNYRVPPELLLPLVPPGSVLDTPDDDPDAHTISAVVFHFADTRALGIPLPTAGWFPEMNLRFYVRRGDKRATVFLREYVPNPLVAFGARWLYAQPYHLAAIQHDWRFEGDTIAIASRIEAPDAFGALRVTAQNRPFTPPPDSRDHFFKEHYWGFDRAPNGVGIRYEVHHPVWRGYPVTDYEIHLNPGDFLGGEWRGVDWDNAIYSVQCAEGSPVELFTAEALVDVE